MEGNARTRFTPNQKAELWDWHRLGIPDTFDRWDDDIGGVRCKGSDTALSSSARQ
jgi:hypothetical protein